MSRKVNISVLVAVLLLVASAVAAVWAQEQEERPVPVSLIRVIANPEKFDGRRLRVIGVLGYGGGFDQAVCLYVSQTDARNGVIPNCISIERAFDKGDKLLGKYVILNASFRYKGGRGLELLSFDHITDLKLWSSPAEK